MNIIEAIFAVFTAIGDWIGEAVVSLTPMFWNAETGLTLLGSLSVTSLGIGIIFLLLGFIINFFQFRA